MNDDPAIASRDILGVPVDGTSYAHATDAVLRWARQRESRMVCAANVHMVMEAHDDPGYGEVLRAADLVTPDGMPLVWMLRRLGATGPDASPQQRVYGPDLMLHVCAAAAAAGAGNDSGRGGVPIGLYGGAPRTLDALKVNLTQRFSNLTIAYDHSPPYRPLTAEEDQQAVDRINASGAAILFVGLGCPKQEQWMYNHRGRIRAVMIGVGAAFDFHAGQVRQAPTWMQRAGLEWLFRFGQEPRRLWRRYGWHNPRFMAMAARQLLVR